MPLSQNTALFSLLGTMYGGDGKSTFGLPNLQGSAPMHPGQGPGLSLHDLGEIGGSATITLLESEIPAHSHSLMASAQPGEDPTPGPSEALGRSVGASLYRTAVNPAVPMSPSSVAPIGGSLPHNNMMPYLTLNFCIALQGVFPPRT
jgi:microcystin-dependent protein